MKRGRVNKRGREVNDIEIDNEEAEVVQLIFDLYLTKGYGPQRISTYLTQQGIMTRKGDNFINATICNMLKNKSYTGILKSGDAESERFPELQIIPQKTFENVQEMRRQRSAEMQEQRRTPLNTKGSTLLSGNVFCGHCGARLIVTTNRKKYIRKDGSTTKRTVTRYVCYNKTRHKYKCDGQTGYSTKKLDKIIHEIASDLFTQLNELSKELVVEEYYDKCIAENSAALIQAKEVLQVRLAEVKEYEAEVIKVIRGESKLEATLLNKLHHEANEQVHEAERRVDEVKVSLDSLEKMERKLGEQYDAIHSWSESYDSCDLETRKMLLSRVFREVKVKRGYEIEIKLMDSAKLLGNIFGKLNVNLEW